MDSTPAAGPSSSKPIGMSSNAPCAACKAQRRKCTSDCVFAPYFPPDNPQKFNFVHKVYGASNVSKILLEIPPSSREDAVNSMAYEAEARLRDPVFGCVGMISLLQERLEDLQISLKAAKTELSGFIGPSAVNSMLSSMHPVDPRPLRPVPPLPPIRHLAPPPTQHPYPQPQPQPQPHPHYLQFHPQLHQQQPPPVMAEQQLVTVASAPREPEQVINIGLAQQKFHQMAMMRPSSPSPSLPLVNNADNSISDNDGFTDTQNLYDSPDLALHCFPDASYLLNQQQQQQLQQLHQTQEFNQQIPEQFLLYDRIADLEFQPKSQPQIYFRRIEGGECSGRPGQNNPYNDDTDHGPSAY